MTGSESYFFPDSSLLEDYDSDLVASNRIGLKANKELIQKTLEDFSIQIDRISAKVGPTVTLYEIVPSPGVRISKIKSLEEDISLSLSALDVRIIAPMPGKGTLGIEVPNKNPSIVSLKSIIDSKEFKESRFDLPIALGKTIDDKPFVVDLAKMPHLLIAGATGQGKSVGLNVIISSLLFFKKPDEVKFILVDPKKVEFPIFSKISKHFLVNFFVDETPILTEPEEILRTLDSLCEEMDRRFSLLKDINVKNIKEYNEKLKLAEPFSSELNHQLLPFIVLVIDEFADLILTGKKEMEKPITRLAQLARAVGIHLVIATQRPSVNIITGLIKANFPARIAYKVVSKIDSRTILDTSGAEKLIGRGDMLFLEGSSITRLQCPYISTPEIEKLAQFIENQEPFEDSFFLGSEQDYSKSSDSLSNFFLIKESFNDPLYPQALDLVFSSQQPYEEMLARKLKISEKRAWSLLEKMEADQVIGPFSLMPYNREVLISREEYLNLHSKGADEFKEVEKVAKDEEIAEDEIEKNQFNESVIEKFKQETIFNVPTGGKGIFSTVSDFLLRLIKM